MRRSATRWQTLATIAVRPSRRETAVAPRRPVSVVEHGRGGEHVALPPGQRRQLNPPASGGVVPQGTLIAGQPSTSTRRSAGMAVVTSSFGCLRGNVASTVAA